MPGAAGAAGAPAGRRRAAGRRVVAARTEKLTIDGETFGGQAIPAGIARRRRLSRLGRPTRQDDALATGSCKRPAAPIGCCLDNGDELAGLLGRHRRRARQVETDLGPVEVKTDRVAAIVFNPAATASPRPRRTGCGRGSGLSDGSRLLATRMVVEGDR